MLTREQIINEIGRRQKEKVLFDYLRTECTGKKLKDCPEIVFGRMAKGLLIDTLQMNITPEERKFLIDEPLLFGGLDFYKFHLSFYFEAIFPGISMWNYLNFGFNADVVVK